VQQRVEAIEEEIANLRENLSGLSARWQTEKEAIQSIRDIKSQIDEAKVPPSDKLITLALLSAA
jgi:ATP-dependent Clp protease ATP-binding subunit ClpB